MIMAKAADAFVYGQRRLDVHCHRLPERTAGTMILIRSNLRLVESGVQM
jgi:hypothetical protein